MYKIYATDKFINANQKLTADEKKQVIKTVAILQRDPRHPGLQSKKIKGQTGLLECRVNKDLRILWQYRDDIIVLLAVGRHKIVEF
jgi:mRNA-degrading endonuclease YafQ of YafQ-DinJ toxin-antitoxin module